METECYQCGKKGSAVRLYKCPICHKYFCEEHAYLWSGRPFCSSGCAEYFFFGDEED